MIVQFVSMINSMICRVLDHGAGIPRQQKYGVQYNGSFFGWLDLVCEKEKRFHTVSINYRPKSFEPRDSSICLTSITAVDRLSKIEIAAIYNLIPRIMNDAVGWFPKLEIEFQFFFDVAKRHEDN